MPPRSVLVVTPCSAAKIPPRIEPLRWEDLADPAERARLLRVHGARTIPARALYQGRHHLWVVEDYDRLKRVLTAGGADRVDLVIVSAGWGVVDATQGLLPYEATFANLPKATILDRSERLRLGEHLAERVARYDAAIFLLGEDYLLASGAPLHAARRTEVYLAPVDFPLGDDAVVVPAGRSQAQQLGTSSRMVKAVLFRRFVDAIEREGWCTALEHLQSSDVLSAPPREDAPRLAL